MPCTARSRPPWKGILAAPVRGIAGSQNLLGSSTDVSRTATLTLDGKTIELPVFEGSEGEVGIDITQLRAQTGAIAYDPAFGNTGACKSAITFIDGDKGILRYRGIPIEQFVDSPNFIEVAQLLINGKLPAQEELVRFRARLTANAHVHEGMRHHFEGFPPEAPPMAILSAMINALFCYDPHFSVESDEEFEDAAASLLSKVRTIAAYTYRKSNGLPFMYPDPNLRYCGNFLHMMFSMPYERYEVAPEVEEALNLILILHADHEQNCSTSTVRVVGSSRANLFASVSAGVCALWGPLHGGANVAVMEMLDQIHRGGLAPEQCIKMAKDKSSGFKLMGFGHRVYKNFDPRARVLKDSCDKVLAKLGKKDPLLDIARKLEELALNDPYFVDRKLYPNVDFYSGIILRAMGIPLNMFTVMFAIGRMPGWIAQWKEQHDDSSVRIARPRQIYTGNKLTDYVPLAKRK
ncbi:MAG: citrate synthase [Candidatus Sumerlaeaceae bacterium]|nr:citrate synthase [Candidatus Sumerlaeaceae bacterium]